MDKHKIRVLQSNIQRIAIAKAKGHRDAVELYMVSPLDNIIKLMDTGGVFAAREAWQKACELERTGHIFECLGVISPSVFYEEIWPILHELINDLTQRWRDEAERAAYEKGCRVWF